MDYVGVQCLSELWMSAIEPLTFRLVDAAKDVYSPVINSFLLYVGQKVGSHNMKMQSCLRLSDG